MNFPAINLNLYFYSEKFMDFPICPKISLRSSHVFHGNFPHFLPPFFVQRTPSEAPAVASVRAWPPKSRRAENRALGSSRAKRPGPPGWLG